MICRNCGTEFEPKKRGRKNNGFCCHKCADAWRQHNVYNLLPKKYTLQCAFCGKDFQTNRKNQKYCSTKCRGFASRGRTEYTKNCLYCNIEFQTLYKDNQYCSSTCASRHVADLRRGEYFCEYCGQPRHSDHPNRNRFCSRECGYRYSLQESHDRNRQQFKPEQRTCPKCSVQFTTTLRGQGKIYCSERCEEATHDDRRAEQLKAAFVEPVGLKTTFRSYDGVCGICGLPVPERNDPASDWGPTVDHIVPLSKGGKHMKSNCQLAHRLCNSLKLDTTESFSIDWQQKLMDEPGQ